MKGNMMNGGMMGMNNNNAMLGNAWGMLMGGGGKNFGNVKKKTPNQREP